MSTFVHEIVLIGSWAFRIFEAVAALVASYYMIKQGILRRSLIYPAALGFILLFGTMAGAVMFPSWRTGTWPLYPVLAGFFILVATVIWFIIKAAKERFTFPASLNKDVNSDPDKSPHNPS